MKLEFAFVHSAFKHGVTKEDVFHAMGSRDSIIEQIR